jgi:tetratricopeptide (TPR) repeat protein
MEPMMSSQTLLRIAMQEHQAGDAESAKAHYEQILAQDPNDADALNLLGVLSLQCGNLPKAQDLIQRAIDIEPNVAEYHHNLGQVFIKSGNFDDARSCYRKSLALDPHLDIAKNQLEALELKGSVIEPNEQHLRKGMKRYQVVQHVLDGIKARTYLEIGVDKGHTFVNTRVARKIGVDPVPTSPVIDQLLNIFNIDYFSVRTADDSRSSELKLSATTGQSIAQLAAGESAELFFMTSDAFFKDRAGALFQPQKIDVAFVDGLHTYEQTYQDVLNVLGHLSDNGVILLHDCNPPTRTSAIAAESWEEAEKINPPGWDGMWCGDVWKSIVHLRAVRNDLNIFVLDCDFGIGVVTKRKAAQQLDLTVDQIKGMTFDDLNANRHSLVNLKPQSYLFEFLDTIKTRTMRGPSC